MSVAQVQRTRGPNLATLVSYANKVPFEEGLRLANERNLVIASSKRLDRALVGSEEWKAPNVRPALPAWSGTMTAYEEPGKKLDATIEFIDSQTKVRYVFPVPKEYKGEKDAILVAEHPDYTFEVDGINRVVNATKVELVSNLPTANGWYLTDATHEIPIRTQVDSSNDDARYLYRIPKRVGPVTRDYYDYDVRRVVYLDYRPSGLLGVTVEAADKNVATETLR